MVLLHYQRLLVMVLFKKKNASHADVGGGRDGVWDGVRVREGKWMLNNSLH